MEEYQKLFSLKVMHVSSACIIYTNILSEARKWKKNKSDVPSAGSIYTNIMADWPTQLHNVWDNKAAKSSIVWTALNGQ